MTIIILYYLIFVFLNYFQLPDRVGAHVIIMIYDYHHSLLPHFRIFELLLK